MAVINEIDDKEKEAIRVLKARMKSDLKPEMQNDDAMFYRFLKARNFNVDNAESMLRKHIEWRQENGVDTILKDYKKPELYEKCLGNSRIAFDKDGAPVRYVPLGKMDAKGLLLASASVKEINKALTYDNESDMQCMKEQSKKLGKLVDKCLYVYDCEDLTFAKATDKNGINMLIYVLNSYQDNYPERLKTAYIINASMYFTFAYSVVKYFLAAAIIDKIRIFGADGWKEELVKVIDADELPAFLGGKKTDPDGDPLCKSFVNHGEAVPVSLYIHKNKRCLASLPGVKKFTLARAAFYEANVEVDVPNSFLEWEFETKCRDIGFGLFYQEVVSGEEKITELIPIQRIDTEEYPETGRYRCERAGTYVMLFDNTYSWIRAKEIYYRTEVVPPEDQEIEVPK